MNQASPEVLQAIAVTAELCGRTFSEAAARVFASDLAAYPPQQVLGALSRCRKEVRGLLTVQDVVSRLDDGRPGAEEAWAMLRHDEAETFVWTEEMQQAWGVAQPLIAAGEMVPARMAFKEAYAAAVSKAREAAKPVRWAASLGFDTRRREAVLLEAAKAGRLPLEHVTALLPHVEPERLRLAAPVSAGAAVARVLLTEGKHGAV